MNAELPIWIERRLAAAAPNPVQEFAAHLAARGRGSVVAVLFYGSGLRGGDLADGLLDFYVVVDRLSDWHGRGFAAAANRLLPPNVFYEEALIGTQKLRAKVAVLSLAQFENGMRLGSLDTTLWARFTQPVICAWHRDAAALTASAAAVASAATTAASWAARLGPESASARDFWRALFRRTYATELRVERSERADAVVGFDPVYYEVLLPLAWKAAGIAFQLSDDGLLQPQIRTEQRRAAEKSWQRRQALGKPLNVARLAKAAFTFDNGADYLAWKIERHSGVKLKLSAWQRRHPILAAPAIIWRLKRRSVLR
ncbi:MAG: hypothetical protein JWR16_956 [Nevskia sp.]|nr:hypothetical protein [Nevskia sp.]